jgi:hypothetical protein
MMRTLLRWATFVSVACLPNVVWAASGISLSITANGGGAAIVGGTMPIGNVNGLGVGTVSAGLSIVSTGLSGGVLYTSPYNLNVTLSGSEKNSNVNISVQVTTNFADPIFIAKNCQSGACSNGGSFTTIPTAGTINVIPTSFVATTQTFTPVIAIFVSNANGTVYSTQNTATITFTADDGTSTATATMSLRLTPQNAVQLTLGTAPGGLTISLASDYTANFGNVNALGVGTPSAGLTKIAAANGTIYSIPYLIQPAFSDQASTTGSIKMFVSTNFANTTVLELDDASSCCAAGSFTALPTVSPGTAQIMGVSSGSSITRYLGLRVKKANGAAGLTGSDSAILTFALTVP